MCDEANDTQIDSTALGVLLEELSIGLTQEVTDLLTNDDLQYEILKYLDSISSIESKEYLSSIPPAPSADNQIVERSLVQDIAELDAKQRQLDLSLKNLVVSSHNIIINNKTQLTEADELFKGKFMNESKDLWRTFNEDKLENLYQGEVAHLRELEVDLHDDDKGTDSFRSAISKIKQLKRVNHTNNLSNVLENINQILNILELPSLTGACIKAGYYSEALEITSYTRRLAIRFPNSDLIKEAEKGIKSEMEYMLTGLIRLLTTNLKQSSIIKTVSYLRRIPPFSQVDDSDGQLRTILLHARYQFIKSELDFLAPLKDNDLHEKYLKRSIEVVREYCFGSLMIYKNIFPDVDETDIGEVLIVLEEVDKGALVKEVAEQEVKEIPALNEPDTGDKSSKEQAQKKTEKQDTDVKGNIERKEDEVIPGEQKDTGTTEETPQEHDEIEPTSQIELEDPLIIPASERQPSNLLLFEFVEAVLEQLLSILEYSLPKIKETSTRDGLYLQLIYCSQSLARVDKNFSDLMTSLLLNAKANGFLIERKTWRSLLARQRKLAQSLN